VFFCSPKAKSAIWFSRVDMPWMPGSCRTQRPASYLFSNRSLKNRKMDSINSNPAVEASAPRSGERQQADSASAAEFRFMQLLEQTGSRFLRKNRFQADSLTRRRTLCSVAASASEWI
jgi:hypothetical protein